jgi:hypothetical protein
MKTWLIAASAIGGIFASDIIHLSAVILKKNMEADGMPEYIEREALLNNRPEGRNVLQIGKEEYNKGWNDCRNAFVEYICEEQSADVAPVRHGRWLDGKCTVCGWEEPDVGTWDGYDAEAWIETPYCPNCGAKMDGE